jgi:hypothetical protein
MMNCGRGVENMLDVKRGWRAWELLTGDAGPTNLLVSLGTRGKIGHDKPRS